MTVLLDQLTKLVVRMTLDACQGAPVDLCDQIHVGPVGVLRIENRGGAFGLRTALPIWLPVTIAAIVVAARLARSASSECVMLSAGLLTSGAVGNALDRVFFGTVTDFLSPGSTVIFNVADVALMVGAVIATTARPRAANKDRLPGSSSSCAPNICIPGVVTRSARAYTRAEVSTCGFRWRLASMRG
jgi:signal peptidase II